MSDTVVVAKDVSLKFNLTMTTPNKTPLDRVKSFAKRLTGRTKKGEFWALKDINFSLLRGELLGIIGRNGSGKTTLGRTLCGIYSVDEGEVLVDGRVSALFSLGGGFQQNLEFTGRENIFNYLRYHNYTTAQIEEVVDDVIEFSELGEFIDAPVQTYSSGMKGRLVFSLAMYMHPDIVILDEVLGAGDPAFQKKAGSILNVFKDRQASIIFISHSMELVRQHCQKVIWLEQGRIKMEGDPSEVVEAYEKYAESVTGALRTFN